MKKLGATKVAAIGYGVSPSSSETAKATENYARRGARAQGRVPNNTASTSAAPTSVPIVLGIKNSGADGVYLPLDSNTNFAIIQGLQQNGVTMKATCSATGYGQDLLDQPIAKTITPNDLLQRATSRSSSADPAVKTFTSNLKKYGGITGVPNYGVYTGYITCDMAILGLKNAGKTPTRQGFVDGLRSANGGMYNSAGLTCKRLDLSAAHFGKISSTPSCLYYVQVKNGKFVPFNGGKPIHGKPVGDPAIIAKYSGTGTSTTATTTPAPST